VAHRLASSELPLNVDANARDLPTVIAVSCVGDGEGIPDVTELCLDVVDVADVPVVAGVV
jgi:hypothetical protein